MAESKTVANQFIQIVPLIMRNAGSDLRCMAAWLGPSHLRMLGLLSHRNFTLSELAEKQSVTLATISNSVARMVERGWVERIPVPADRRAVQIVITPSGRRFLDDIHSRLKDRIIAQFMQLTPAELDQLEAGLIILNKVLDPAVTHPPLAPCEGNSTGATIPTAIPIEQEEHS